MTTSTCPKCDQSFSKFKITPHSGIAGTKSWKCISLNCPNCGACLGAQIDPIAIKTDIVSEIEDAIKKWK